MMFIGVDPGVHGGIAFLDSSDGAKAPSLTVYPMPIIGDKEYDIQQIKNILLRHRIINCFATIEKQHCMPGEGLPRTFKTGFGFGILLGMFAGLDIPHQIVSAKTWQARIFKGLPLKQDTKVSSAVIATRLYPNTNFRISDRARTIADGMTDAACIATFTREMKDQNIQEVTSHVHSIIEKNPHVCVSCGGIL